MKPADIDTLVSLSSPSISPDGAFAVFASSRPDPGADRSVGQLWRIGLGTDADAAGGPLQPRRLTRGIADAAPQLSPDGRTIAFLRPDGKGRPQLHLLCAEGGEPLALTDQPLGVGAFVWSPDGSRIAFLARVPEQGRYGTVEGLTADAEPARRITGVRWHANGIGYTVDRPRQIFVVEAVDPGTEPLYPPAPSPEGEAPHVPLVPVTAQQLTHGAEEHTALAFTAGGGAVLAVRETYEHERRDLRTALVALPVGGSAERELLGREAGLSIAEVAVATDGRIALLAHDPGPEGRDFIAPDVALWLLEETGPRRLMDAETPDLGTPGAGVVPVGDDFLVLGLRRGRVHALLVSRAGQTRVVIGGDVQVTGADAVLAPEGPRIVAAAASPSSAGEILLAKPGAGTGEARVLTDFGAVLSRTGLVIPHELEVSGRDGYPVHGWLAVPEEDGPHPVVLMIHGGPYHFYGVQVLDEVQVLVDAGYAVVYCNPRGSAGYGRAHGRAIRQRMGTFDLHDVLDFLDGALAADEREHGPRLDSTRLGIMGGSYGGYLTAWTIAHDHRFAGAIVERGFLDPAGFQGTSDIGSFFGDEYVGTESEDIERQSPFAQVHRVRTPALVIHSELDFRCPLDQATRYYTALKRHGVETELLVFPGENHELTRSGRPRHRIQRFEAVLDWWERRLGTGEAA